MITREAATAWRRQCKRVAADAQVTNSHRGRDPRRRPSGGNCQLLGKAATDDVKWFSKPTPPVARGPRRAHRC